ncbi:hypothetical protein NA78x_002872 [Anatilimnocola sp. NA78]|uniref:hypothetical protein n=1 Tax=Anatilimnocola sp. NA78 TaxID=3415683 RepID=UPI003CE55FE3
MLDAEERLPILMRGSRVLNGQRQEDDSIALLNFYFLRLYRQLGRMLQVARAICRAFAGSEWNFGL